MEKKSIDIVRELVEKKREEAKTPEQKRALDDILNMMNENDFFFLTVSPYQAARLFTWLDIEEKQAIKLYRDLVSKKNKREFRKLRMEQKKDRGFSLIKVLKKWIRRQ